LGAGVWHYVPDRLNARQLKERECYIIRTTELLIVIPVGVQQFDEKVPTRSSTTRRMHGMDLIGLWILEVIITICLTSVIMTAICIV
jgi:hypothetical protein